MPCNPETENCRAKGKVGRIFPNESGAFIWLKDIDDDWAEDPSDEPDTPGGRGYFRLLRGHANYNALYSLVLVAATNDIFLMIETEDPINPNENAYVNNLWVDW